MADTTVGTESNLQVAADKAAEELQQSVIAIGQGDFSKVGDLVVDYLLPVAGALLLLIVAYFVSSFVSRLASKPITKRVDETVGRFIGKLVFYSLMTFTVLGVLGMFGVSVASFAAVIAAAGFAIGLAFQGTLSNFSAGILLLVFRPFKVGDVVNAGGITGKVYEIDLFTTTFDTFDNRRIIVPNSSISGNTLENVTYHSERRVDVFVGAEYSADIKKTRAALTQAAESLREHLIDRDGRGYQVYLLDLAESSVNWVVRFWTPADIYWEVKERLIEAVKNSLDSAGIGIPFPQMDVHIKKSDILENLKAVGE
ncbi:MAG: mechanosensitive ion channel [Bdellovibrionales bacterium]|nr:mechanosensitive ion channel [Bdellovibrionales bacterium]